MQIPQYVFIIMADVLISITGLQFTYTEAPTTMKAVTLAFWYINNSMGNLLVVLISEFNPFKLQSQTFFLYAALMFIGVLIFHTLAANYQHIDNKVSECKITEQMTNGNSGSYLNLNISTDHISVG